MDLNRKVNHSGLVDIKVNMICIFIILSWPLILHVIQKCNADSTIRTLYMLELSLLKKNALWKSLLLVVPTWQKLLLCMVPSFKICFYGWSPLKKPGFLGWVRFFTGIALSLIWIHFFVISKKLHHRPPLVILFYKIIR